VQQVSLKLELQQAPTLLTPCHMWQILFSNRVQPRGGSSTIHPPLPPSSFELLYNLMELQHVCPSHAVLYCTAQSARVCLHVW
jgi:hypothetical protein